jgi:hypothetical protein
MGLLWLTVLASACGGHTARVQNPSALAALSTPEATEQAILDALPTRGWSTEEISPGRIVAFLSIRAYLVRCEITYDEREVRIAYLDSDQLGERRRGDAIYAHRNVNKWMKKLAASIQRWLQTASKAQASGGP